MTVFRRATLRSQWWLTYIRSIKYCHRCGKLLKRQYVREEKTRRHVCTKCGNITYLNPKIVAAVIPVDSKGRIGLLKRAIDPARSKWTYPAGFQELGETIQQAAHRESWEEIRAHVKVESLLGIYSYTDAGVVTIVFCGRVKKNEKPSRTPEALEIRWFRKKEIPWKELAFRSTREALRDFLHFRR
ncbi:hypothetical protein BVX98_06000 [bacterium F11]|nr:hypothetical protein BVX98_06000 [bacterium F11]